MAGMVKNKHRVHGGQWRKWRPAQRVLFNETYEMITEMGCDLFVHPKTVKRKLSPAEFRTIAHNAAWSAADRLAGIIAVG